MGISLTRDEQELTAASSLIPHYIPMAHSLCPIKQIKSLFLVK